MKFFNLNIYIFKKITVCNLSSRWFVFVFPPDVHVTLNCHNKKCRCGWAYCVFLCFFFSQKWRTKTIFPTGLAKYTLRSISLQCNFSNFCICVTLSASEARPLPFDRCHMIEYWFVCWVTWHNIKWGRGHTHKTFTRNRLRCEAFCPFLVFVLIHHRILQKGLLNVTEQEESNWQITGSG